MKVQNVFEIIRTYIMHKSVLRCTVKTATLILGFATIKSRFAATFESVSYKNCSRSFAYDPRARTNSFVRVDEYMISLN